MERSTFWTLLRLSPSYLRRACGGQFYARRSNHDGIDWRKQWAEACRLEASLRASHDRGGRSLAEREVADGGLTSRCDLLEAKLIVTTLKKRCPAVEKSFQQLASSSFRFPALPGTLATPNANFVKAELLVASSCAGNMLGLRVTSREKKLLLCRSVRYNVLPPESTIC